MGVTQQELYALRQEWIENNIPYQFVHHTEFNYKILDNIMYLNRPGRKRKKQKTKYNKLRNQDLFVLNNL